MRKIIKDYFSFTKKERVGVTVLVFVIISIYITPYLLPEKKEKINQAEWEQFKSQSARLAGKEKDKQRSTEKAWEQYPSTDPRGPGTRKDIAYEHAAPVKGELFYFDPNSLPRKGWEKLGLRAKTITIIQNYLSKGGKFRLAEDLGKIYGLHKEELERLVPYVRISGLPKDDANMGRTVENFHGNDSKSQQITNLSPALVTDINFADTTALIALPGIGSKLAARIINFREKLGAFHTLDQLSDVYGLPDSTFQKLRPRLTVSPKEYKLLNINSADINELKQLPYLKWNAANAILEFRRQHGPFKTLDELLQIDLITPAMLKKMAPYLAVE